MIVSFSALITLFYATLNDPEAPFEKFFLDAFAVDLPEYSEPVVIGAGVMKNICVAAQPNDNREKMTTQLVAFFKDTFQMDHLNLEFQSDFSTCSNNDNIFIYFFDQAYSNETYQNVLKQINNGQVNAAYPSPTSNWGFVQGIDSGINEPQVIIGVAEKSYDEKIPENMVQEILTEEFYQAISFGPDLPIKNDAHYTSLLQGRLDDDNVPDNYQVNSGGAKAFFDKNPSGLCKNDIMAMLTFSYADFVPGQNLDYYANLIEDIAPSLSKRADQIIDNPKKQKFVDKICGG